MRKSHYFAFIAKGQTNPAFHNWPVVVASRCRQIEGQGSAAKGYPDQINPTLSTLSNSNSKVSSFFAFQDSNAWAFQVRAAFARKELYERLPAWIFFLPSPCVYARPIG